MLKLLKFKELFPKKIFLIISIWVLVLTLCADWTIVDTYQIPNNASGLAFDGEFLYCGIYGVDGNQIYEIDPNDGAYSLSFTSTHEDAYGLTHDGDNLWTTDHPGSSSDPAIAIKFDEEGEISETFELPDHYMSGIAYDNGDFWVTTYYISGSDVGHIYKLNSEGTIITDYQLSNEQPWDICTQDSFIWIADYNEDMIYKTEAATGEVLESYESEGEDPAGIVYDGSYLWYCDEGQDGFDYLYKVDLGGTGTPEIAIDPTEFSFGNTVIGETDSTLFEISNNGNADLSIEVLDFSNQDFYTEIELPLTISPEENVEIPVYFTPEEAGQYNSTLTVLSSDPINPSIDINLDGFGLYTDPNINITPEMIDFGEVRLNALTSENLTLYNLGNQNLTINEINLENNFFYLENSIEFPLNIAIRDTIDLRIWFTSGELGEFQTIGEIESNDPENPNVNFNLFAENIEYSNAFGTELWWFDNQANEKITAIKTCDDINQDGFKEIIVADNNYSVYCLNGNSSESADVLWSFSSSELGYGYGSVYSEKGLYICDDLNNDGIKEIIIGTAWGGRQIIALNGFNGDVLWNYDTHIYGDGGWVYQVQANRDFNGDEYNDVLAATGDDSQGTGPKRIFLFDGISGEVIWEKYLNRPLASVTSLQDQNNDGVPEVFCGEYETYPETKTYLLDGSSGDIISSYTYFEAAIGAVVELNDIDGDQYNDFAFGDYYGNLAAINSSEQLIWQTVNNGIVTDLDFLPENNIIIPTIIGTSQLPVINAVNGNIDWSFNSNGNIVETSYSNDLTGNELYDVIISDLSNTISVVDSEELLFNTLHYSNVADQIITIPDINNNNTPEIIAGFRNGHLRCISSTSQEVNIENHTEDDKLDLNLNNYPNPFRLSNKQNTIKVSFNLNKNQQIKLEIYNIKGQKIKTLLDKKVETGKHSLSWTGRDQNERLVSSGIYFIKLQVDSKIRTNKILILK